MIPNIIQQKLNTLRGIVQDALHIKPPTTLIGRLYVRDAGIKVDALGVTQQRHLIAGTVLGEIEGLKGDEMWECEIVLIPRKKWRKPPKEWKAARIDQILTDDYANEKRYGENHE